MCDLILNSPSSLRSYAEILRGRGVGHLRRQGGVCALDAPGSLQAGGTTAERTPQMLKVIGGVVGVLVGEASDDSSQ